MKRIINLSFLLIAAMILVVSCKKDEERTIAKVDNATATVSASASNLVLTKVDAANTAVTFNWSADYGYNAAVTYTLELAVKGTDFAGAREVILDAGALSKSYTVVEFNSLLLSMNLIPNETSVIQARIKSQISEDIDPAYSTPVEMTVTPYPSISYIYVPGDYQGWNPSTADSLISATDNGIYEGVIYYPAGGTFQFKLTPEKKWDVAYGDDGAGKISTTGGNLTVPGAGRYKLTANLNDLTFEAVSYQWGIIGDAPAGSSWTNDIDMSYDNGTRKWTATVTMGVGVFKFRLNHDWGTNFGDDGADGSLEANGANIAITTAGDYEVVLDLANNTYTLTKL